MTLTETGVRLQKAMAAAGVASRRASENLIVAGRVKVNGKVVRELGTRIDPATDSVWVDERPVQLDPDRIYLAFHKPRGVVSTMADEFGRRDLSEYFLAYDRVFNVGRLDAETTGILLMTNDGDLANKLAHPSFGVEKLYVAQVRGRIERATLQRLITGVKLEDGLAKADSARILDVSETTSLVEVVMHSGKNRIVRRMFEAIGHEVIDLTRRSFGPLRLGNLKPGAIRELGKVEVSALLAAADAGGTKAPGEKSTKSAARPRKVSSNGGKGNSRRNSTGARRA
jgi:23S rRNA pseudouridine2605 synthase